MKKTKWDFWNIISLLFFTICFLLTIYVTRRAAAVILDSDASSELILAHHLADKGTFMSTEWLYSSELRVLNTQLIFMPLFRLLDDWSTVRFIGTIILQCLLILSYWYLTRSLKIRSKYFFFTAGLLILPSSGAYAKYVLYHCYYIPHIALGFLLMGLFCRLQENGARKTWKSICLLAIFLLISFGSGLGGIRQLMATFAPLVLICFLLSFRQKQLSPGLKSSEKARLFLFSQEGRALILSLLGALCAAIGYLINSKVFAQYFSFQDYEITKIYIPDFLIFEQCYRGLMSVFGFRAEIPLMSVDGIASICSILYFWLVIYFSMRLFLRRSQIKSIPYAVVSLMFLSALVINLPIMLLTFTYIDRYLILVTVLFIPLLALLLNDREGALPMPRYTKTLSIFIGVIIAFNSFYFARPYLKRSLTPEVADKKPKISLAADYLKENDYEFGFSTFWNANIVTELTDGIVEVASVQDLPTPHFFHWLALKDYERQGYHTEKTFLLLSIAEEAAIQDSDLLMSGEKVYQDEFYVIYDYPSDAKFAETLDYLPD